MEERGIQPWQNWKPWAAAFAIAGALAIFLWLNTDMPRLGLFWLFGLGIGFVLQRSRFCFVSAVSNCFLFRDTRLLEGLLAGLFIATIGFAAVMYPMMPQPGDAFINTGILVTPFGWHLVLGGVIFGFGMLLSGGCIVGNLFRIGEGGLPAVVAFLGILLGLGALQFTWPWWWQNYISKLSTVWLPAKIGWAGAIGLTLLVIAVLFIIVRRMRPQEPPVAASERVALSTRLKGLGRAIFKTAWPLALGGVVLGLINVLMLWLVDRPWTVTGELMTWAQGLFNLIHLPPPVFTAVPGTWVTGSTLGQLTWGLFLNTGIIAGSFIAATLSGEFRLRRPRQASIYIRVLCGGLLMGYGAGLASACTIGGFFSAVPSLGLNGFVFGASLLAGALAGLQVIKRLG